MDDKVLYIRNKKDVYVRVPGINRFVLMTSFKSVESAKRYATKLDEALPGSVRRYEWVLSSARAEHLRKMIQLKGADEYGEIQGLPDR